MIPNALKARWSEGKATLNGWLSIGDPFSAEIMAAQGYDSLTVDLQHGFLDYSDAKPMLQAIRASGAVPMARVPWNEPGIIMKCLDAGAYGIICPMVSTPEEAAALVDAMRYPPRGNRSFGPTRASFSAGGNYASEANDNVVCFAMIETAEAVKNVDAIAATPGLDGLYIGPADLTLGVTKGRLPPGFDRQEDEMIEVIKTIREAARKAGIIAALHCGSSAYAAKAVGWGFNMVTLLNDVRLLAAAAGASVKEARGLIGSEGPAAAPDAAGAY